MREAADAAPDAAFAIVEHGGHAPFLTHADEVAALLDGFLQGLPA
jgi:pimeloyl-[acyl-carrier protein] methyl ester esterase